MSERNVKYPQTTESSIMNLNTLSSIVEELETTLENEISPYRMSKIVNDMLSTNLPPQMFYNYIKSGYITSERKSNKIVVKKSEVIRWIKKYALNNIVSDF